MFVEDLGANLAPVDVRFGETNCPDPEVRANLNARFTTTEMKLATEFNVDYDTVRV